MRYAISVGQIRRIRVYRGWPIVAIMFLATGISIGASQYAFGLFIEPLQESFGWSRTQISASLSFAAVGSLTAPFVGRIMDRVGARPVMVVSLLLVALSFLLRPLISELWHWYGLSLLQFLGFAGASIMPAGRLVGIWFSRTRGRMMGLTVMGNNFGGLVVPPFVGAIITAMTWREGYLAVGAVAVVIALMAVVVVKEFPTAPKSDRTGDDTGGPAGGPARSPTLTGWTVREAVRTRAFYAITGAVMFGTFTYAAILPQVHAHLTASGASIPVASAALSSLALFGILGKLVFGYLAERLSARRALMIDLAGQSAFLLLMIGAESTTIMWVSVPMFGLCMGGFGALFTLLIQESYGIRYFGSIMGLVNLSTVVSLGIGPLMAGASYDLTDSYASAFVTVAVLFLLAAVLLTQARVPPLGADTPSGGRSG